MRRLIDANALDRKIVEMTREPAYQHTGEDWLNGLVLAMEAVNEAPTVDAVEVDTVIEMFEYMLGDCPCNFSPVDEWLAERCELQNECPNPKDKRGCWKQFIKHFIAEMDGDKNV